MEKKYVGATIDAGLWNRFVGHAKASGKSVPEALEAALRAAVDRADPASSGKTRKAS